VKSDIPDICGLNSDVDLQTAAILGRMVAKDPAERFQSCHDLVGALEAHALVAKGGTVKLPVAKPALPEATMVGAPTPGAHKPRVPTPPPRVATPAPAGPPPVPVAAANAGGEAPTRASAGGAARPSVLARSQRTSSPVLPLA